MSVCAESPPVYFYLRKTISNVFFFHSILRLSIHTHTRERAPHTSTGNRFVTRLYKNYPRVIGQLQFADSFSSDNTGRSTRATVRSLFDVLLVHIIPRSLQAHRATLVSVVLAIAFSSSRVLTRTTTAYRRLYHHADAICVRPTKARLHGGDRGGPVRDLSAQRGPGGARADRNHSHAGRRRKRRTAITVVVATTDDDHHRSTPGQVR